MTIGEKLRNFRKQQHVGMRLLSARSGINSGEISRIETGKIHPQVSTLQKYAKGMNVSVTYLFNLIGKDSDLVSSNNHPTIVDLDRAFKNHDYFTYHNKKLDPDTIHYIESSLKLRYGSKNNK